MRRNFSTTSQEIQKMYEKAGYPHTTVTYRITDIDEHSGTRRRDL